MYVVRMISLSSFDVLGLVVQKKYGKKPEYFSADVNIKWPAVLLWFYKVL